MTIKARDILIEKCSFGEVRLFIETNHYSGSVNGVKVSYCFKATYEGRLIGAVLFGAMSTTAWKKFSSTEVGVIELRRLVLLDEAGRNSESRLIGYCLRWIKANDKDIEVVVSYADPKYGHSGTIYRASNFTYMGLSGKDKGYYDPETGRSYHSRALRTKYKGEFKPFVKVLRDKKDRGILIPIDLPSKHCFTFRIK